MPSCFGQVYKDTSDAEEEWKILSPIAYDLHDELLHVFRYAYRKDEKLMALVDRIAEGSGNADLVMDLGSLAMLGTNNPLSLESVSFDITKLATASSLSDQCNELLGRVHETPTLLMTKEWATVPLLTLNKVLMWYARQVNSCFGKMRNELLCTVVSVFAIYESAEKKKKLKRLKLLKAPQ